MIKIKILSQCAVASLIAVTLIACGGGGGDDGGGTNPPSANVAPTADAGSDQTVDEQTTVTLSGSGTDSDGSIVSYSWTQTSGTSVNLNNANSAIASFVAPDVAAGETLTFALTVTDDDGLIDDDTVLIFVTNVGNAAPTASAGSSKFVTSGEFVVLDASASTDAESTITYEWKQLNIGATIISLSDKNSVQPYFIAPTLSAAETFIFEVTVIDVGGLIDAARVNVAIKPVIYEKLTDTGVTRCSNYVFSYEFEQDTDLDCSYTSDSEGHLIPSGQDGHYGRDVAVDNDFDGISGFSYTKLDMYGKPLPQSETDWSCVLDNLTGLIWEVKSDDGGIRDKDNYYSWYNSEASTNGGNEGSFHEGSNTENYIAQINDQALCGVDNWRLPTSSELVSIIDYSRLAPTTDNNFFPNTLPDSFWSSESYASNSGAAVEVSFENGLIYYNYKSYGRRVRLVRSLSN